MSKGIEVTILGSGTGIPSLKRGAPGLAIKLGNEMLLFDSGPGTLNRLLRANIDYRKIDYIFYTHFHPDHTAELVPFLFACKYHSEPRKKPLKIIGPKGIGRLYSSLLEVYGEWITPRTYSVEVKEILNNPYKGKNWTIYSQPLKHTNPSLGYRILKNNRSVVYSGDTDYCKEIIELGHNADLLILECSFPEKHYVKGHLIPSLAGKVGKESGCKRLLLTHIYPICDKYDILSECKKIFKGKINLAKDLMRISL